MFLFSLVLKTSSPCATQKGFTSTASRVRKAKAGQQEKDLKNSVVVSFFGFYIAGDRYQLRRVGSSGRGTAIARPLRGAEPQQVLQQVMAIPGLPVAAAASGQRDIPSGKYNSRKQEEESKGREISCLVPWPHSWYQGMACFAHPEQPFLLRN